MQRKILAAVMTVLFVFGMAASILPQEAAAADNYAWVLVKTEYNKVPRVTEFSDTPARQWENNNYYHNIIKADEGYGEIKSTSPHGWSDDYPPMYLHAAYTWDAPPRTIKPGQTVSIRVNQDAKNNEPGGYSARFSTRIMGGSAQFLITEPAEAAGTKYLCFGWPTKNDYSYDLQGSGSVVFSLEIPWGEGREGSQQDINIGIVSGSDGIRERYIYQWQQVSGTAPAPSPQITGGFSDLSASHWAYTDIINMVELGILSGYPDGTFKPNKTISRAEFATIMVSALDLQTSRPAQATFTDVPASHWAYGPVESARDYLTGYRENRTGELTFDPSGVAVREDVAVAIVKARGFGNASANQALLNQFPDQGQISQALREHVALAVEKGYMRGTNLGFEPLKALTRAEACALLARIMESEKEKITF